LKTRIQHPAPPRPAKISTRRSGLVRLLMIGFATLVFVAAAVPLAAADETHIIDESLSLTGDCSTSLLDEIPDPGLCPMPPGVPGVDHPSGPFREQSVAVDTYGDRYVASVTAAGTSNYHVDVFGPDGSFITEVPIAIEASKLNLHIAVDSHGVFYLTGQQEGNSRVYRYSPTAYEPASGEFEYADPPALTPLGSEPFFIVDLSNDRVFYPVPGPARVREYGSATEGNVLLDESIGPGEFNQGGPIAIDARRGRIYMLANSCEAVVIENRTENRCSPEGIAVFDLASPHSQLGVISGAGAPAKQLNGGSFSPMAVDEETGHLFYGELGATARKRVYEFELIEDGAGVLHEVYVSTIERSFAQPAGVPSLAVDNGPSPAHGTLYVPSGIAPSDHLYAFKPVPQPKPPAIESSSVGGIGSDDAVLRAEVNPQGFSTSYRFEYTTQQHFEGAGETFAGATLAREGTLPARNVGIGLSVPLSGLKPGTAYRFRIVAKNEEGEVEEQRGFATYPLPDLFGGCPNESLRVGASATLPDCRAWELVTPSDTNGHQAYGLPRTEAAGTFFPTRDVSPAGDAVSFLVEGGAIPDFEGTGGLSGDAYLSTRGAGGWRTVAAGPDGAEVPQLTPGSPSSDQRYSFYTANGQETFLRYPDGRSVPIGRGSLGTDPSAAGQLIAPQGRHVIFTSKTELEEEAPASGTTAIYDRTIEPETGAEQTHVLSLLPGDVPTSQSAFYLGASPDGRGIAFKLANTLYLRYDGESYDIGETLTFAAVAEDGKRIFYLQGGNLWRFDVEGEVKTRFTTPGNVTPVNISADGSTTYFVSPSVLAASNPHGEHPQAGARNLYRSEEGRISFVGTVTERDVAGENKANFPFDGLGLWISALDAAATDPSRSSRDGTVLLFSSRAELTDFDSEGRAELYRYDAAAGTLACISCPPSQISSAQGASLLTMSQGGLTDALLLSRRTLLENLRPDGRRAFFESTEPLVAADVDGVRDVYEWEEDGLGSCGTPGGCIYLISSGRSALPNYLYAVSESGNDVFIETSDLLLALEDPDNSPSIYDARVEGGFAPAPTPEAECLGEACQPGASPPSDPTLTSSSFHGSGNLPQAAKHHCPKGTRKVRRAGRVRCVKRHSVKHTRRTHQKRRTQR
jgi:hypothetical protein